MQTPGTDLWRQLVKNEGHACVSDYLKLENFGGTCKTYVGGGMQRIYMYTLYRKQLYIIRRFQAVSDANGTRLERHALTPGRTLHPSFGHEGVRELLSQLIKAFSRIASRYIYSF